MTVTVQVTPPGSPPVGVSVKLEAGDALSAYVFGVPTGHSIVNELVVAATLSLKLTVIVASVVTPVAPLVGVVVNTLGAASVVKLNVKLAAIVSGGSNASVS